MSEQLLKIYLGYIRDKNQLVLKNQIGQVFIDSQKENHRIVFYSNRQDALFLVAEEDPLCDYDFKIVGADTNDHHLGYGYLKSISDKGFIKIKLKTSGNYFFIPLGTEHKMQDRAA